MTTIYFDEAGFTGEDLLDEDQPIFAQSSNNFCPKEADEIIAHIFGRTNATELKHTNLSRRRPGKRESAN
ncbi:MAG: hypothetical protein HC900_11540 [Methylacidiphilales bacterium]|nr:hypothetical protein [Candidatus Methylacidiphilales bacterium]